MTEAKNMFLQYSGNIYFMEKDGVLDVYHSYGATRRQERQWAEEYVLRFLAGERDLEPSGSVRRSDMLYHKAAQLAEKCGEESLLHDVLDYPFENRVESGLETALLMMRVNINFARHLFLNRKLLRAQLETYDRKVCTWFSVFRCDMEKSGLPEEDAARLGKRLRDIETELERDVRCLYCESGKPR